MVEAQQMQERSMQVMHVKSVADRLVSDLVGGAMGIAGLGAAAGLSYVLESGETPDSLLVDPTEIVEVNRVNPYDGTGTELVTYRFARPVSAEGGRGFFRVRPTLP